MVTFVQDYRPIFIAVTFAFLGSAFYLTYRPHRKADQTSDGGQPARKSGGRNRMMAVNKVMLWAVTALAVVFLFFPQVVTDLFASDDDFTSDMQKTVVAIEGMT